MCSLTSIILFPRMELKLERINIFTIINHFKGIDLAFTFDWEIPYEFLVHSRYFIVFVTAVGEFFIIFSTWQSWHREIILAFIDGPVSRWNLSWLIFADSDSFHGQMILSCANNGHFLFPVAKMFLSVGLFRLFCLEFGGTRGEILNSVAS